MSNSDPDFRDGTSLSIEETNKVRLQLGLKPLELNNSDTSDQNISEAPKANDFVHAPAKNIGDIKSKEKLEEKLKRHKENREINEMLANEMPLSQYEKESTMDFLKKVEAKRIEIESQRKKEEEGNESSDNNEQMEVESYDLPSYRSKDLCGIPIEHKASRFEMTGPTILTLKDSNVLGEENGDVLVNVNLVDYEKAERNVRNRKMTAYSAYIDSDDEDDPLSLMKTNILAKYDESIDGVKKNRFVLDSKGRYDMGQEKAEQELRESFYSGKTRFSYSDEVKVASDYFTAEEMNNKIKMRKRKARGTRTNAAKPVAIGKLEEVEKKEPVKPKTEEGELAEEEVSRKTQTKRERSVKRAGTSTVSNGVGDDDDDDDEDSYRPTLVMADLESSVVNMELKRQLSLMKKAKPKAPDHGSGTVTVIDVSSPMEDVKTEPTTSSAVDGRKIILTKTEEYTKSIYGILQSKRKNDAEIAAQIKEEPIARPLPTAPPKKEEVKEEEEPIQSSGWQPEEKILSLPPQPMKKKRNFRDAPVPVPQTKKKLKLTDGILGDEVQINSGIFTTLMLAKNKGYLDEHKTASLITNPKNQMLRAQNFQEEKIRYDDIDQKCPRRERRTVPETAFQDKSDFVPDIKLDYHDEFGRPQPPKEAFRSLSHRFHGKTSGKIKSEKRFKKLQEQSKITSSIGDSEMKRVNKMQSKMKSENRFCVPLSGKNSIIPAALKKGAKD